MIKSLLSVNNVIALLLTLFVLSGFMPSVALATHIVSGKGYLLLGLLFILSLCCFSPVVSIILLVACYDLVRKAHIKLQKSFDTYLPSEATRNEYMEEVKYFPNTLEEKVIGDMVKPVEYSKHDDMELSGIESSELEYTSL